MPTQTIVCTALPAGVQVVEGQRHLRLSAFISPRLTGDDGSLAKFTDWHDWPAATIEFSVTIGSTTVAATKFNGPMRSDLWRKLFRTTSVLANNTGPSVEPKKTYVRS